MARRATSPATSDTPIVTFRALEPTDWAHVAALFGDKGACGGCWCMWWRSPLIGKEYRAAQGDQNRDEFRHGIEDGSTHGILAFEGDQPVGWCTFGPREDFPRLGRTKAYVREDLAGIWSIPCFYIPRTHRGMGVARGLLQEALRQMKKRGARIAEAYPVPLTKAGERLPATFAFTGPLPLFEELGFEIVQRASHSRPLVRRRL